MPSYFRRAFFTRSLSIFRLATRVGITIYYVARGAILPEFRRPACDKQPFTMVLRTTSTWHYWWPSAETAARAHYRPRVAAPPFTTSTDDIIRLISLSS